MKKLFLIFAFIIVSVMGEGYEFQVSPLRALVGTPIPRQVWVRNKAAAVIFLKTNIAQLVDLSDSTLQQDKISDGYVLYVAPDWSGVLFLTAPGFFPKQIALEDLLEEGSLPPGTVWQMTVRAGGKDPKNFNLSAARLSFEKDPANATSATSQTYAPEIWINTDVTFNQVRPLLREGGYQIIEDRYSPYRISPLKKKAKAGDILSPLALEKLGDIAKMPLEEKTVYNLDIVW